MYTPGVEWSDYVVRQEDKIKEEQHLETVENRQENGCTEKSSNRKEKQDGEKLGSLGANVFIGYNSNSRPESKPLLGLQGG